MLVLLDISIEQYVIYFYWMCSSLEILMYNEVIFDSMPCRRAAKHSV